MKHESKCINLTVEKIAITDEYNTQKRESFLQSQFWADFKSKQGWQNTFFCGTFQTVNQDNDSDFNDFSFSASVLIRPLLKFFSVAYIPMGPTVYPHIKNHTDFLDFLVQFSKKIRAFLPKNVLYIRFDPPIRFFNMNERDDFIQKNIYAKKNLCKSPVNVQPQDTILLDLRKTADELLTAMKPKWRYNIRLAEKKGVKIYSAAGNTDIHEAVEIFYELYK
ncbi:MAG: peptidoglycan bridge formation glycyltransferase FemA/FemB family protein, partial [Spirochaetales bacterium]